MKKYLIFPLLFFVGLSLNGNAQNLIWAKHFSGIGDEVCNSIAVGPSGSVYTVGQYSDSTDFDPGTGTYYLDNFNLNDGYISKLDGSGNFVWAKLLGSQNGHSYIYSIICDDQENIYVTGSFAGTLDLDPGPNTFFMTASPYNAFLLKLDFNGNFIWAKRINSGNFCDSFSISVDGDYNIYSTGRFQGTSDFDPGPGVFNLSSSGYEDIFISKLDSSGNFIWANEMGETGEEQAFSIRAGQNGSFVISGVFEGTIDFDPGVAVYNLSAINSVFREAFVAKYDSQCNLIWAKQTNGVGNHSVTPYSMALDNQMNVYMTGYFSGNSSVDFDPGSTNFNLFCPNNNSDIFIWKLDQSGNFCWVKMLDGNSYNWGNAIAIDNFYNIHSVGHFVGMVDFDPDTNSTFSIINAGFEDGYISVLDSSGQFISAKALVSDSSFNAKAIAVDVNGNNFVTGDFKGTTNFDAGGSNFYMTPSAGLDAFIIKNGSFTDLNENFHNTPQLSIYPNPNDGHFKIQSSSNIVQVKIINPLGKICFQSDQIATNNEFQIHGNGLYFTEIMTNKGRETLKFIVADAGAR